MSQRTDYEWFKENLSSLYEKYGDTFLLIKNEEVLGTYDTYADGVHAGEDLGLKNFSVQQCGRDESCYTAYIN